MQIEMLEELAGKEIIEVETYGEEEITIYTNDNCVYKISGSCLEVTKEED